MIRSTTIALAAVLLVGTAAGARGQDEPRASRFEVGVYAGGSLSSAWFDSRSVTLNGTAQPTGNGDEESFQPGYAPVFGAQVGFWPTPTIGLRLHGAYAPMRLPGAPSDGFFDAFDDAGERAAYTLNTWIYDLSLVVRPFVMNTDAGTWRTVYLWAGGGGVMVDQAGEDAPVCQPAVLFRGACLSQEPGQATVGQGTAGAGMDLFRLGGLVVFGEAGVHVYDSPVHVGDEWTGPITAPTGATVRVADDRAAVTPRLVLGLKGVFGNFFMNTIEVLPRAPLPPPPPPPMAPPPPPPPGPVDPTDVRVCVIADGRLTEVPVLYNPRTGDTTTMDGRRFSEAYPTDARYAAGAEWFINNMAVTYNGRPYVRFGLPRVLGVSELTRAGEYRGVGVYVEAGVGGMPEVVYIPVRPGCEFQPYQFEAKAGGVRG